jgi:hypothetical protein
MAQQLATSYPPSLAAVRQPAAAHADRPFTPDERNSLDALLGAALIDPSIRQRLVHRRDTSLLTSFAIPAPLQLWLKNLPAGSIMEIAQAIAYHP